MQGRIVKGIAGFYYVDTEDGIFECRAKGIFRNQKVKPLVGDLVELEVLSQEEKEGSVISILPRKSELIRPGSSQCGSGTGDFCTVKTDSELAASGSLSDHDETERDSDDYLF